MKPSEVIYKHRQNGIETLRARFNHRSGMFEIVKSTLNGGWRVYGGKKFATIKEAEDNAMQLAEMMPLHYRFDDCATEFIPQKSYRDAKV